MGGDVVSLALAPAITDPDTGEEIFPDPEQDAALIAQVQQQLAARSGIPIEEILKEQERKSEGACLPAGKVRLPDFQTRLTKGDTGLYLPKGTPQNSRTPQPAAV